MHWLLSAYLEARKRELQLQLPPDTPVGRAAITKQVVQVADIRKLQSYRKRHPFVVAAVELGLSNSRLEGINAKIRLIQRRGYGYHSVDALAASIYLCLGGITVQLPTRP